MKNFTHELKNIMTEDPGIPIMSPDELRARSQTIVILTNSAPDELLALAGPDRKATLLSINPPMITLPYQKGVFKVRPEDIVFENHHSGRDVTEAGADETPYEKFFSQAMKKFGVSSPIELDPEDTKKFFNYVDKNWEAEEETDEDTTEDVSTGKVGKKDKGSYQHAYKLALKKYKIHSADELDTPAERKGFTDYVDRLWKKGDIHRDKKEAAVAEADLDEILPALATGAAKAGSAAGRLATKTGKGVAKKARKTAGEIKRGVDKIATDRKKKKDAEQAQREREQEEKKKEREREQASRDKEREQKAKEKDNGDNGNDEDNDDKKKKKEKGPGFGSFIKQAAGQATSAAKQQAAQYKVQDASISKSIRMNGKEVGAMEGAKKTPGVSKKARGAVGFAKHARKGTGAKRQFQKGVRQAGKKQARNEVSPPDRKHQVKGIKKHMAQKKGKDKIPKTYVDKKTGKRKETNPWALAWAQYDKYGVPSRIEKD